MNIVNEGMSGSVGNNTANITTSQGSNPGDPEAALASGSRPLPTLQWKICRGPLDEQKIPRGGARVVQPGMPFPNLCRCNKVLVNQKKKISCYELGSFDSTLEVIFVFNLLQVVGTFFCVVEELQGLVLVTELVLNRKEPTPAN